MNPKYHDIIVEVYSIYRPSVGSNAQKPFKDYAITAGVSSLSSRIEKSDRYINDRLPDGWAVMPEGVSESKRKIVRIILPDDVHYDYYTIAGYPMEGLHSESNARDGMGPTVYAYCNAAPVYPTSGNISDLLDDAIKSGITLSVPRDEGREEVPVEVVKVSELYGRTMPAEWANMIKGGVEDTGYALKKMAKLLKEKEEKRNGK